MCDYGESPAAWSAQWRRARKEHRCCACREGIRPGDRYHHFSGVWDGSPGSYKHCARCWHLYKLLEERQDPYAAEDGAGISLTMDCGELWRDNFNAPEPAELAFLTPDEAQALAGSTSPPPNTRPPFDPTGAEK
jgi:hypothetical protein